ncbi:MFS transporter [bacterium LRH843]|nr:MFS transporter [bacterium LRH843]
MKSKVYYGWYIVLASSIVTLVTVGMRMSVGPFFLPILADFDMTRTHLSAIIAVGMFVYGIAMPLTGYLEKILSTRFVLISGAVIVFLSCLWMIYANSVLSLLLSFGVFLSLGLAFTSPVALTPVIARWFVNKRGQALFYLATGSMAGIAVMNPVFTVLIELYGWQQTMFIFALTFLALIIPTALFVIREDVPPEADRGHEEDQVKKKSASSQRYEKELTIKEAVKTLPFWQISLGLFACGYSMNLIGTHGIPMLVDHGFSEITASFAIGLIGLVAIAGTLLMGKLSDQMPRKNILAVIYLVRGIGFIFLVWVTTATGLYAVAIIAGFVWAGSNALSSAIITDLYGVRLVGILYGWAYFSHQVAATISSLLGGWGYETFQTHFVSFGSAALVLFVASWISYRIPLHLKMDDPNYYNPLQEKVVSKM